jgi:hypothetical protein
VSGRRTHYAGGAFLGLTVGALGHHIAGWSAVDVLAFGATAAATGGGHLSMDYDQGRLFRWLRHYCGAARWLGGGGPFQHRGILHWAAWPAVIALTWWAALARLPIPGGVWWLGYGVALGWASHVLLDLCYGHTVRTPEGAIVVRRGVPLILWYAHRGGIWTSSGPGSSFAGCVLACATVAEVWLLGVLVQAVVAGAVLLGAGELLDLVGKPARRAAARRPRAAVS